MSGWASVLRVAARGTEMTPLTMLTLQVAKPRTTRWLWPLPKP